MIIKKTKFNTDSKNFPNHKYKTTVYYIKKPSPKPKTSFQQELFSFHEPYEEKSYEEKSMEVFIQDNLEDDVKKMFLGEVIKKDHLFSSSLTELQKENIIKISELYY